jgi:hypothetical protein
MMHPLYQIVECDRPLCGEQLEVRIYDAKRLDYEVEEAVEENGWAIETDGHKCPRHKYEPMAARS